MKKETRNMKNVEREGEVISRSAYRARGWTLLLLAGGMVLWIILPAGPAGEHAKLQMWRWIAAGVAGLVGFLPPTRRGIAAGAERIRNPSSRTRAVAAVIIAVGASL